MGEKPELPLADEIIVDLRAGELDCVTTRSDLSGRNRGGQYIFFYVTFGLIIAVFP